MDEQTNFANSVTTEGKLIAALDRLYASSGFKFVVNQFLDINAESETQECRSLRLLFNKYNLLDNEAKMQSLSPNVITALSDARVTVQNAILEDMGKDEYNIASLRVQAHARSRELSRLLQPVEAAAREAQQSQGRA